MEREGRAFTPTLANLVAKLKNKDADIERRILNVYLWGSRVYGLANENSDYDFLVVTTHEDEPTTWNKASATDNVWCGRTHDMNFPGYDDDDVNVSLVSAHYWRRILKEELVVAFEVDEDVLRRTVMFASRQRFSIAQWHWESPAEIYRRKKDIITDYSAANEYYHRIMAEPNVKAQVDFEYYRNEKERIAKAFKGVVVKAMVDKSMNAKLVEVKVFPGQGQRH
ncbi:uncharacterized protein ACA1_227070 [Acanthamoeba castellanii str. Neff]|uniref:Polymerase nucleotidyl transferase domain-containing protein n=1 Tax=Acanthamoeba castellanii (strain ATCC 30010 / Neff) TaxID=1257118 RepID=L8H8L1_ACACF|nr:uncharacterized protein ACA1_227070 [Acanthamoeba castellanii str. Neff]ELR21557.1 hypothetical protein ACA1_227070 [Acanthamoeba castellanii str. Neff]